METLEHGPYVATRIQKDIWSIDQDYVRSFLVTGSAGALLIDACDADADLPGLVKRLTDLPVTLVQTHCDHDHIGASHRFAKAYMHPSEFSLFAATGDRRITFTPIREGECIDLGNRRFAVVLLPGHTPGSIALLDTQARLLFSGDSVKADIIYMFGSGRDISAYIDSMERLYAMRDRYDTILPSHGPMPITARLLPSLIQGAKLLRAGKLLGADDGSGLPCKLYTYQTAKFYF